jgi:hypothetical protein
MRLLAALAVLSVSGCAMTNPAISRSLSAGAIGCAPADITIENETATAVTGLHNWIAVCKDKRFVCSYQQTTGVNCKEAIQ